MKKKHKILLTAISVVASLVFFTQVKAPAGKLLGPKFEYEEYYAPVSDYFYEKSNLSFSELKSELGKGNVEIEIAEKENLRQIFGDEIDKAQIKSENKITENRITISRWSDIGANSKTLSVDNKFLWEKNDSADYKLKTKVRTDDKEIADKAFDPKKITKLVSTGDVIMSRTVAVKMREKGMLSPWENVKELLSSADLTFISLEAPFSDRVPAPTAGMNFVVPTSAIAGLLESGVDVAGIANNHSTNFGLGVFDDNLTLLKKNNMLFTGGGNNLAEAETPVIIEKNGIKYAFLDWNSIIGAISATETTAGVAPFKIRPWFDSDDEADIQHLESVVAATAKKADVVVVQFHWGTEYKTQQSESQQKVGRRMIDAGADLIIGTHPHAVQGSEYYHDRYITYSLGNFIFDQEWSQGTKEGSVLESYFYGSKNVSNKILPVLIEDYHKPRILTESEGQSIIQRIKSVSLNF